MEIEPLLTAKQVAKILNCSLQDVYKHTYHGLPFIRTGKKGKRFLRSDVRNWIMKNRHIENQADIDIDGIITRARDSVLSAMKGGE